METILLPLSCRTLEHPAPSTVVCETGTDKWQASTRSSTHKMAGESVMDTFGTVTELCRQLGGDILDNGGASSRHLVARFTGPSALVDKFRAQILDGVPVLDSSSFIVAPEQIYTDALQSTVREDLQQTLANVGNHTDTALVVTHTQAGLALHIFGEKDSVVYARYQCKVFLSMLSGHQIKRISLPLSKQPLIFGPNRTHLMTIFEQTNVNVFSPPLAPHLQFSELDGKWCLDEMYLVGDGVQISIAEQMLREIAAKTDIFSKSCVVPSQALDVIRMMCIEPLTDTMTKFATFIQVPNISSQDHAVHVIGTNQSSVERSIEELMRLCTRAYKVSIIPHTTLPASEKTTNELASIVRTTGATILTNELLQVIMCGERRAIHTALDMASHMPQLLSAPIDVAVSFEQSVELKDFLAGKKQGKILKVMSRTNSKIIFTPLHDYNFSVTLAAENFHAVGDALKLLEDELPAEKQMHIPEPYHKQVIGAGGAKIQGVMRRHNVFVKFSNADDKVRNAFGNVQIDNVMIRCPAKNAASLEKAAQDLQQVVQDCSKEHLTTYIRLSRSHRRFLTSTNVNVISDIERRFNAVVKFPKHDTRTTELLEISGLHQSSVEAAQILREHLPFDFEFRVAWNPRFGSAVGSGSDFAGRITAPFRVAFGAQVQAFEKVQMQGDMSIYSQIVVSMPNEDEKVLNMMSKALTVYLRSHGLDIIDKGPLNPDPIVEGTAGVSRKPLTTSSANEQQCYTPFKQMRPQAKIASIGKNTRLLAQPSFTNWAKLSENRIQSPGFKPQNSFN